MADDFGLHTSFPNLHNNYKKRSGASTRYNCIAWAAGESHRHWWPDIGTDVYWPLDLTFEESLDCTLDKFIQAFELLGYECCEKSTSRENGYQKIAIYVKDGKPSHAARQLWRGSWVSKIGTRNVDIEHTTAGLEEGLYGTVAQVMKRPWTVRNFLSLFLLSLKVKLLGLLKMD